MATLFHRLFNQPNAVPPPRQPNKDYTPDTPATQGEFVFFHICLNQTILYNGLSCRWVIGEPLPNSHDIFSTVPCSKLEMT